MRDERLADLPEYNEVRHTIGARLRELRLLRRLARLIRDAEELGVRLVIASEMEATKSKGGPSC